MFPSSSQMDSFTNTTDEISTSQATGTQPFWAGSSILKNLRETGECLYEDTYTGYSYEEEYAFRWALAGHPSIRRPKRLGGYEIPRGMPLLWVKCARLYQTSYEYTLTKERTVYPFHALEQLAEHRPEIWRPIMNMLAIPWDRLASPEERVKLPRTSEERLLGKRSSSEESLAEEPPRKRPGRPRKNPQAVGEAPKRRGWPRKVNDVLPPLAATMLQPRIPEPALVPIPPPVQGTDNSFFALFTMQEQINLMDSVLAPLSGPSQVDALPRVPVPHVRIEVVPPPPAFDSMDFLKYGSSTNSVATEPSLTFVPTDAATYESMDGFASAQASANPEESSWNIDVLPSWDGLYGRPAEFDDGQLLLYSS